MAGCFMKRNAYIKFVAINRIVVTSAYRTKEFVLREGMMVDLVAMKEAASWVDQRSSRFFFTVCQENSGRYRITVEVRTQKNSDETEIAGELTLDNGGGLFSANVWTD